MNRFPRPVAAALFALVFAGCAERIQHGLNEEQANEVQTILLEAGFQAKKVPEAGKKPTWAIEIDGDHAQSATRVLAELGLPREKEPGLEEMREGLVPTPTQERAALLNALAGELSGTLETVAGVTVARVHLTIPQPARPGQVPGQAKASAFLLVRPGHGPHVRGLEEDLRRLIAGSVEGLSAENVALVVNEVVSSVPAPTPGVHPAQRLRALLIGMGVLVSLLAILLVVLAVRMRSLKARAMDAAQVAPVASTRPIINAANTRKAA